MKRKKTPPILSKGARAWFMALYLTSARSVGRFRISARRRLFWNLLNFSEPEGGLNIRIYFFFFLSHLFGALCDNPPVRHLLASRSRDSVSASVRDTNSSIYLLGRLGQGRLGGPVTTKAICQACNGLRVQQPPLCSNLCPLSVPWEMSRADCTAGPRPGLYREHRDTPRQVKQG